MSTSGASPKSERHHRDLAAPLHQLDRWPDLPDFFKFVIDRSLKPDLRPGHLNDPLTAEADLIGTFLLALVVSGAFPRLTVHAELTSLTTSNFPVQRTWFQLDAYKPRCKPSTTGKPETREQKIRFPLPQLCLALLYRLIRFYDVYAATPPSLFLGPTGPHIIDIAKDDNPLFPPHIRKNRKFLVKWLAKSYRDFRASLSSARPLIPVMTQAPKFSFKHLVYACQIWRLQELPPWIVAGLSQRWKSSSSSREDVLRILFGLAIGGRKNSPINKRNRSQEDTDTPIGTPQEVSSNTRGVDYDLFPPPLSQAYVDVTQALGRMHADMSQKQRYAILEKVRCTAAVFATEAAKQPSGLLDNARYLLSWLEWLLSRRSMSPETILTYYKKLQVFIFYQFQATPITAIDDPDEFLEIIEECMHAYDNPESQRNVKKAFRSFLGWAHGKQLAPKIPWNDSSLHVYRDGKERAIVSFEDMDKLLAHITDRVECNDLSVEIGARFRIFCILCFFGGLRRRETVRLTLRDLTVVGPEILLWIRQSKTRHGIRLLPLDALIPEPYLTEIVAFHRAAAEMAGPANDLPLLPDDDGQFCRSSLFSHPIGRLMKKVLGFGSAHTLRHGFATWFLVRTDLLLHGLPENLTTSEFSHVVFGPQAMAQFSFVIFGKPLDALPRGAKALPRPLHILSMLIGHACPEITLSIYAHSLDWVYFLILLRQGDNPTLLGAPSTLGHIQASNLLIQSSENQYKNGFAQTPTLRTIITLQQAQLFKSSGQTASANDF